MQSLQSLQSLPPADVSLSAAPSVSTGEVIKPETIGNGDDSSSSCGEGGDANNGTMVMMASGRPFVDPLSKCPKKDEEIVYIQVSPPLRLPATTLQPSGRPENSSGSRSLQTLNRCVPQCGRDPLCIRPNKHCGHCKHLKVGGAAAAKRAADQEQI